MYFINKVKNKIWSRIVRLFRASMVYPFLYRSYWNSLFGNRRRDTKIQINYLAAVPNVGAGIGHQMANWIAGYWFAQQFKLRFAHIPFSLKIWEDLLGFGENEANVAGLLLEGYRKVRIPLFKEENDSEVKRIKQIIASYWNKKVVFVCEQDQFYRAQFGVMGALQEKFYNAPSRITDKLIFSKEHFNIAVHVRRGDIVKGAQSGKVNHAIRFQSYDYFENILHRVLGIINTKIPVHIYLFSQGSFEEFKVFDQFKNMHFCLDMSATDSFLHMVKSDLLVTSKSSFSYKPALLSKGIKICPDNFWHGYPENENWIISNENGVFDNYKLARLFPNE